MPNISKNLKVLIDNKHTSHTSDVVVELFLQSGGTVLLPGEVVQVFVEDFVCGSVYFAEIL